MSKYRVMKPRNKMSKTSKCLKIVTDGPVQKYLSRFQSMSKSKTPEISFQ